MKFFLLMFLGILLATVGFLLCGVAILVVGKVFDWLINVLFNEKE